MRSDCSIFFLIAIVARVLNSDIRNSDGNKSSTNSFNEDFNSKQYALFDSFNSIADFALEYFIFNSLIALIIELISELVISERLFFEIGLPLRYKTASTLVTKSISVVFEEITSVCLIFFLLNSLPSYLIFKLMHQGIVYMFDYWSHSNIYILKV